MQDYQPEIYMKGARNPPCAHGEGEYLFGGERSQASLPSLHAIEHDPCPN